ncbi:Multidrug resistance protein pgp-3 [Aphelenchoides besseyi]|nr:Multidrug resistance protein pgp-3 [Aphelenchoides besseyi]
MSADEKEPDKNDLKFVEMEKLDIPKEVTEPTEENKFRTLYTFADGVDVFLGIIGLIFALVQAVLPPFVWLVMGDFVSFAINREEVKEDRIRELKENEEFELSLNVSAIDAIYNERQINVDAKFQQAAMPVFIAMISLSLATFIAAFIQRLVWEFSSIRQVFRARKAYVRKLLHMDVSWLESRHSGQIASTLHDHADSIHQGIADHVPMTVFIFSYLAVTLGVCFYIQWDVTLVMLLALPVLIGTRMIFSKWFCKTMDDEFKLQSKMTNLVSETFSCIRTVISFGAQRQTINKFERLAHQNNRLTEERLRASSVYDALAQLAINMLYVCVTSITIGFHLNGVSSARQNANAMQQILNETPLIEVDYTPTEKSKKEKELEFSTEKPAISEFSSSNSNSASISFKNVRFCYPTRPNIEVLKGVSLEIKAGEHLAIVGSSGSGKSTLTALVLRFYDPTEGMVEFDGVDLRNLNPDKLRAKIGLVSQEPALFDGTISDNIRYGKLSASQAEVNDAARRAEAWNFINQLPDGMRTRVGDRGLQLSGGQKQRVAIGRAIIRSPSLIIFDEATSALDSKNEGEVQKAIDEASKGITTITIAHRLTTVKKCDRIVVLDAGFIVEEGTPEQLMANSNGRFYRMYADQKLDALQMDTPKRRLIGKLSIGASESKQVIVDPDQRRAWARSSLGHKNALGKSYSMLSNNRLKLPVLLKKRGNTFKTNVMEVAAHDKRLEEEELDLIVPNRQTSFVALVQLIRNYRSGYSLLASAIPSTILRGLFFLLVCFEVASILEITTYPEDEIPQRLFYVAAIYISLIIIKTIFEAVGRLVVALYGHGFCAHLRSEMFRKLLRHGAAYFDEEGNTPGRLTHKLINDTASLQAILGDKLDLLLPAVVCSTVSISVAIWINWKLALLCGFQFPAFILFRLVELHEAGTRQRQMAEEEKKAANLATIVLSNMSTIKAYTLQSHFHAIFHDALKPLRSAMKRQSCVSAFVFAFQFSFSYILIAVTLYFGKDMMLNNEITPFDYLRVVLLTQFGANFISQLIASVADFSKARVAAENILEVMREPAVDMDNLSDQGLQPKVVGRITLQHIEFRYPSRPAIPVLKNVSFRVSPGESVAIVGPSGSGKSSIIALLQRLYTPNEGKVILDKSNIRTINPGYLRRVIVSVGQEPTLFSFTIRENIAYGLPDDEATMPKIIEAAKIANIHDFICSLPKGYDTEVGEFGGQLSGGQKQRIAIARALVRKPLVLLLDEATAALDSTSEKAVQQALEAASKSCTCIHVAHRLSSIRTADKIIVLVDGEIAETGTHAELMAEKSLYYEMNQLEM